MEWEEINSLNGYKLDVGCGGNKQKGFIGMDLRELPGVDIVHNLEVFPWPLPKGKARTVIASHVVEHIKPWLSIDFMNECWRVLEPGGEILISTPYPGSRGFWQDPTHCNGWSEVTWQYFDPRYPLYGIYNPKPWKIRKGFPAYQVIGNLEIIMEKITEEEGKESVILGGSETISISVAEVVETTEKIGGE